MPKTANHNTIVGIRNKMERKEINEIRDGAISTLYQKLKNKIIDPTEITHTKNKKIVGSILCWINDRASENIVDRKQDAINTLSILARTDAKSQKLINKYGTKEFFLEFKKDA